MDRHDSRVARSRAEFLKTMTEISGLPRDEVDRDAVARSKARGSRSATQLLHGRERR